MQILPHINNKMKISYTEKISEIDHPVIIVSDKAKKIVPSLSIFDKEMINIVQEFLQEKKVQILLLKPCLSETNVE